MVVVSVVAMVVVSVVVIVVVSVVIVVISFEWEQNDRQPDILTGR